MCEVEVALDVEVLVVIRGDSLRGVKISGCGLLKKEVAALL